MASVERQHRVPQTCWLSRIGCRCGQGGECQALGLKLGRLHLLTVRLGRLARQQIRPHGPAYNSKRLDHLSTPRRDPNFRTYDLRGVDGAAGPNAPDQVEQDGHVGACLVLQDEAGLCDARPTVEVAGKGPEGIAVRRRTFQGRR